jgi:hypothetical protein
MATYEVSVPKEVDVTDKDLCPGQVWVAPGPIVLIVRQPENGHNRRAYLYTEGHGDFARAQSLSRADVNALDLSIFRLVFGPAHLVVAS